MIEFLRSDEALMVYSNSQELLAIANMFNINISIFTYGGAEERWDEVKPDPAFVARAELHKGKEVKSCKTIALVCLMPYSSLSFTPSSKIGLT